MLKLLLKFTSIVLVFGACRHKETRLSYFDNGQIREKVEIINSKKNGTSWMYDSAGHLMSMSTWKDDMLYGPYESYYDNGKILKKGTAFPGKQSEMTEYYPSGRIRRIYYISEAGLVMQVKAFLEDGTFDRTAFIHVDIFPFSETQKLGSNATLRARVVNVYDSMYLNGTMIVTSRLIQHPKDAFPRVADTLALIRPTDLFTYSYEFKPKKIGYDTLKAMIYFERDLVNDQILMNADVVIYPFYVE